MSVSVTSHGLRVGDKEVPLLSGAVHYWRLDRRHWGACLDAVVGLGFPLVETYVPWSVHERSGGSFDFGESDPRKDLGAFLDLAAARGLGAIVRPGPHINAELTYFGYPERLLRDESILARSARGAKVLLPVPPRMFPVPSYACDRFFDEVRRWFEAVARVVGPRLDPAGPVVLVQVDNEAALFFRDSLFEQDYHPESIASFRRHLAAKYGTDAELRSAWGDSTVQLEDVDAPRARSAREARDLVRLFDWAEFHEELPRMALERLRAILGEVGLGGVPTSHNLPPGQWAIPLSIPALERTVDIVGIDLYSPRADHRTLKQRVLFLEGTARLPYAPELGGGAPPWYPQLEAEDARFLLQASFAWGLRGYNLYMAVDRDRWVGAPIGARGERLATADAYAAFHRVLGEHGILSMRRKLGALVVVPRAYMRLSRVAHAWGPVSPSVLEQIGIGPEMSCIEESFGFPEPVQIEWVVALRALSEALERARVPFAYLDGDAGSDRFLGAPLLCVPSFGFQSRALVEKLERAARAGGSVVCAPRLPSLDESMRPCTGLSSGATVVDHRDVAALDRLISTLADERHARSSIWSATPRMDVIEREGDDGRRVVFVVSLTREPSTARIEGSVSTLVDLETGERIDPERVAMGSFQVRILGTQRADA
ncbi:MAG: beta-galactosidase [Deltaproteobacteria bacterium]|nr:beta-galactosidase [Deltaproteobacteria bacterium]